METALVTGPLANAQSETGAQKLRGLVVSNTHETDSCVWVVKNKDTNGKIICQGSVKFGETVTWNPNFSVGCAGVYVSLTGGTGAVMLYFD